MDARVQTWLTRDPDPDTRQELQELVNRGDDAEIEARFAARLAFGTAGLRGLLGAGPGRMNRLVVRETTAGLATYLLSQTPDAAERGVVVGFDGRRGSRIFAEDVASVLGAMGIQVHLFDREVPTPVAGFAVRTMKAAAGVVITASHNPPQYNGYKVYWGNGAQIIAPHDAGIAAAIERASQQSLPWQDPAALRRQGLIASLGDKTENGYLDGVSRLSVHREVPVAARAAVSIAYTPLHGVGARMAEAALARAGFEKVFTVAAQREPDGAFPTVRFPNPEEPGSMDAVLALAEEKKALLACANDPDADRLAVAVRTPRGPYRQLSGDEVGILLGDDLLRRAPKNAVVATTIVSSRLLGRMATKRGVGYFETLTGFKWIANGGLEQAARGHKLVFGYEEALGYTIGDLVWDKDGVSALVAFAELTAACHEDGISLVDRLEAIYREHGLSLTGQRTLALEPGAGPPLGERLRANLPESIAGRAIESVSDLREGVQTFRDGRRDPTHLPRADVLVFALQGDERVIVRPSGTEPKMKCYYEVSESIPTHEPFEQAEVRVRARLLQLMEAHQREIARL
jgi:phosphomannomutase